MTKPNIGTRLRWKAEREVERLQDINADLLAALEAIQTHAKTAAKDFSEGYDAAGYGNLATIKELCDTEVAKAKDGKE